MYDRCKVYSGSISEAGLRPLMTALHPEA